jgi:chromosome segregation ATPase
MATQQSPLESTSSVHTAHLQDLQHSLSVKTLAFQTLQREFNSLLQKLERQRTKCATMEKKFEVSDAEIIGLSNEKDRLEENVEMLESQLEKMRNDRDEARRANSESAAQYLRIVEMAGRLQGKAGGGTTAESGKPWEKEREELLTRVKELESAAGVGSSSPLTPSSEKDTQIAEEVRNLRERNAKLEKGLASAKQAALLLAAQGQNVGMVLHKALEDD